MILALTSDTLRAGADLRRRRRRSCAEARAGRGRRPGQRRRRRAAGGARRAESDDAEQVRHRASNRSARCSTRQCEPAEGQLSDRRPDARRSAPTDQLFKADDYRAADRRVPQRRRRSASPTSATSRTRSRTSATAGLAERQAGGPADHLPAAGRQHHRHGRPRPGAAAAVRSAASRRRSTSTSPSTARPRSAPRCTTSSVTLRASRSCW